MDFTGASAGGLRTRVGFSLMGRSLWTLQARMCPTIGARLRLLFVYAILAMHGLTGYPRQPRVRRLRIRAAGRDRDWWVADPMEVAALWTVFVGGEYGDYLPPDPRVIVDAGANIGSATLWFRERFPDAQVIALEPNPQAFERLRRNFADDPNVQLVNAALADSDRKASFAMQATTTLQGRLQSGGAGAGVVEVDALTIDTVADRFAQNARIDLLKLNIEGAEWEVLDGSMANVGTVTMEIHEPVPGDRDPDAVLQDVSEREGFELRQGFSQTLAPRKLRWLVRPEAAQLEAEPLRAP